MSGSSGAQFLRSVDGTVSDWSEAAGIQLDPPSLIESFPGPALHVDSEGGVLVANAAASPLAALLALPEGLGLRDAVQKAAVDGGAVKLRAQAEAAGEWRTYDLTFLPTSGADAKPREVLIIGRDTTLEHNFTTALVASRQLFKDLVTCSADFAWETDAAGAFSFISPAGALGYAADDLVGADYRALIDSGSELSEVAPFACRAPQSSVELRLRGAGGELAHVLVSSLPVASKAGEWQGARGVCSDVTQLRQQEAALRRAHQREGLMRDVVDAIRTEVVPETMYAVAAGALAESLGTLHCWVTRWLRDGSLAIAASRHHSVRENGHQAALLDMIEALPRDVSAVQAMDLDGGEHRVLLAVCEHQGQKLGHLCLARSQGQDTWSEDDIVLASVVADQLGIAMAQAKGQEELAHLSRTDDLTGLMNRRAMKEVLASRLQNIRRLGGQGALLYLDLDNFKATNDTHGHNTGDAALREFAALLADSIRKDDLAARVGGDEFVLWLEGALGRDAVARAESLLEGSSSLGRFSGDEAHPLTVSIGVAAITAKDDCDLADLMHRVDQAMYRAKRNGKNNVALAESPRASEDGDEEC